MVKPRLVKPMMMGGGGIGGGDRPNNNPTSSSTAKDKNGRQQSSSMQPLNPQQNRQQQQQQQRVSRQQGNRRMSYDDNMGGAGVGKDNTHHLPHLHFGTPDISRFKSIPSKLANMIPRSPTSHHHYHNTSDASDLDYAESQHHHSRHHYDRHHRPPFRRRESHGPSRQEYRRPFQIPSHVTLSSRADLWITVALSSLITLVSFAQLLSSADSNKEVLSTSNRQFAFTTSILSFLIATVLGVAFRHAPARHQLTRCITSSSFHEENDGASPILSGIQQSLSQRYITIELLLVSLLSFFWIISIPIIVDGFYTIRQDPLAVSGTEIWNANLFYSSWISVILVGYIHVELITSTDRYGTLPASSSSISWKANTFSKRWILLTLSSIVVMSSSANIYGSNLCYGSILKGTTYCRTALMGIMIGGFVQLLFCCCVGVLYRLRNMNYTTTNSGGASYYYDSRGRRRTVEVRGSSSARRKMSIWKRDKYSLYFAIVSLIIQSINVALITNPVGGGPGNSSGSLYFASWLGFFLVFEMFLRYLELHTTSVGRRGKRKNEYADDSIHSVETGYSSEEDDLPPERQSNVERILRTGSLGSRTSSGADVYEANDSYSAEYQSSRFQAQAPRPPSQQQPQYLSVVPMKTEDGPPTRPQKEPEEEMKTSPNSSSRDFGASIRDFSIGSRQSSRDPSVDGRSALYSEASDSEDISNEQLFQEQGRSSYATYNSKEDVSEGMRTPDNSDPYLNLEASRHSKKSLSPLNESSREGRRSSSSLKSGSGEQKASQSGSEFSDSRQSGSRQSGSRSSYESGSQYTSEDSREENVPNRSRPNSAQKGNIYSRPNSRNSGNVRSRSGSRGKSKSPRSRGSSYENSYIQTDSDSASSDASPPPTESDAGQSQKSNLSGFSEGSPATQSQSKSTRSDNNGRNNGPPPPPFQPSRQPQSSLSGSQFTEDYQNPRPVKSVFARKGLSAEDESVVSDPTLDPCFHNIPVPTQKKRSTRMRKNFSDPSFEKSVASSDASNYRRSSSDELPSSEENLSGDGKNGSGDEQVDNIVAAALAFAEKTHSVSSYGLQRAQASGTSSKKKQGSGTSGGKKNTRTRRRRSDSDLRESQTSGGSSAILSGASLHSFYSGDPSNPSNAGFPPKKKKSESEGFNDSLESNPTNTPSVEDMVSAAIAYAEKSRGVRKSANSSGKESNGKSPSRSSVGSMFSDSEAYSEASGSDFDC